MAFDFTYVSRNREVFSRLPVTGTNHNEIKEITTKYGNHGNYKINQNYGCSFHGSLCKYFYGNNFQTLNYTDFKLAIERMSDELHIDFRQATVSRLDIADNLQMNYNPVFYTPCVLSYPRLIRHTYQTGGVELMSKSKTLRFYCKSTEAIANDEIIPEPFLNYFFYRLELSFMGHVRRRVPFALNTVESLFNPVTFRSMIEYWGLEFYSKVQYREHAIADIVAYDAASPNDRLWLDRIRRYGREVDAIEEQKMLYASKQISYSQYRTAIKKIKTLCAKHVNYDVEVSLKNELLQKIEEKTNHNLALVIP